MVKKLLPLFLILSVLVSCKNKNADETNATWIGGQIINPAMDYILLAKGPLVLDTIKLDSNNFFLYRSDKIKEGLYSLRHRETQVFYLEPGDSLLLHLNTVEFDESLAYSGKGAEKNNLLMDLYLQNEQENKVLPKWYTLTPELFTTKIDSLKSEKEETLKQFFNKNEVSEDFKDVAEASVTYDYYSKKEMYAMANRNRATDMGDDFFAFRNNIDYNNEKLRFYYPYYRFLNRHINSILIAQYPPGVNRNSYDFSLDKLNLINDKISNDSIKNSLMHYTAYRYLYSAKDADKENQFLEKFLSLNNNESQKDQIRKLTEATVKLANGNKIPNIQLVSMDNTLKSIESIATKPTVLFFWSATSPSQAKMVHRRAAELKSKYPEYNFAGINRDNHFKKWRNIVQKMKFDPEWEFQLDNVATAEKSLVLSSIGKSIILDKNAIILDGNTNMFNSNFEELLLGFLNR